MRWIFWPIIANFFSSKKYHSLHLVHIIQNMTDNKDVTMDDSEKLNKPGYGWANQSMYPLTREGRMTLYSSQRR